MLAPCAGAALTARQRHFTCRQLWQTTLIPGRAAPEWVPSPCAGHFLHIPVRDHGRAHVLLDHRPHAPLKRFLKHNGLALAFGLIFLAALAGQSVAGYHSYNEDQRTHAQLQHEKAQTISYGRYLTSSSFGQTVTENWQSEYLQFSLYIFATIWLLQRGSPESKELDKAGTESDQAQKVGGHADNRSPRWAKVGGVRTFIYSNSLLIVMTLIFFWSWFAQSVTGWSDYNSQQIEHKQSKVSWRTYATSANFWEDTLQNWQSEFLAVGSMVILSVYLRQRGSPESKPVGAPHDATGVEG